MSKEDVQIPKLECRKCGHTWTPRKNNPKMCPECKTRKWNKKED